ncbi:hypothetical protein EJ08DRAFT_653832 [Tothia fuscella]|uniref:Uncharacterized protein n=1 Tax=Tothia fuscella TaxID=1048955 RepID=A0A9P4NGM0_9PEZI|nr:hypothetical protein EJ08DRAFT_653832 [Tothia fuscella]
MGRVHELKEHAKAKAKDILHIDNTDDQLQKEPVSAVSEIANNPVFNPSDVLSDKPDNAAEKIGKVPGKVHSISHKLLHPASAGKEKASHQLGITEKPYLENDASEELLDAYKQHEAAEATQKAEHATQSDLVDGWNAQIEAIQDDHEKRRVAWTSGRFIHRARVIRSEQNRFPVLSLYHQTGKPRGYQWSKWFQDVLLYFHQTGARSQRDHQDETYPEWDQDLFIQHVERVLMASTNLQRFLLRLHEVWSWKDSQETAMWFVIWMTMWYFGCVLIFAYGYGGYVVFAHRRKVNRQALLQASYDRATDPDTKALTFGEMIERHGQDSWIEPMIEAVGPQLQVLTRRTADALEKLTSLYEWKNPQATGIALTVFAIVVVFPAIAGNDFAIRLWTFLAIVTFFGDHPTAVRFPNFRKMLSPIRWIFGVVPTENETAFEYLRAQGDDLRAQVFRQHPTTIQSTAGETDAPRPNDMPPIDIFAAHCKWNDITGIVIVSFSSIRFTKTFPREEVCAYLFTDIDEILKSAGQAETPNNKKTSMEIVFTDGSKAKIEELKNRDELFNVVIAFSDLKWEQLQPRKVPPKKGVFDGAKSKVKEKIGVNR